MGLRDRPRCVNPGAVLAGVTVRDPFAGLELPPEIEALPTR